MDDLDRLVDLWVSLAKEQRQYGSHLHPEENREPIRMAMAERIVEDGLLLAREDGDPIGFVMFEVETGSPGKAIDRGIVRNVYVVPESRNEGVGSELFDAAEAALCDRGVDAISLSAMAGNEDARRFYRRRGYRPHRVEYELSVEEVDSR